MIELVFIFHGGAVIGNVVASEKNLEALSLLCVRKEEGGIGELGK